MNLATLFDSLQAPSDLSTENVRFSAVPIPGHKEHRLGKDAQGAPLLLIAVTEATGQPCQPAPIVLQHLTVEHGLDCRVSRPDGTDEQGLFTVVRCTSKDRGLRTYFLHVAGTIVTSLLLSPSIRDVTDAIDRLVELFRAMTELPRKSVQGLWAELFCIARTREPAIMLDAWHQSPDDLYDFNSGKQRLDVKSASGGIRQHYFALTQLRPPAGTTALFASLFVDRAGGGASVAELADRIRGQVTTNPKLLLHLDRVIAFTLGNNWRAAIEDRFDQELAAQSLAFFEADVIPSVNPELPPGVSDVRFRADLTNCPTAGLQTYRSQGGLFRVALRR
jgi:hypothetical protein